MISDDNLKSFFHNFIESLPCGVMILDGCGNIVDLNRNISFMMNILGSEPVGSHYSSLLGPKLKNIFDKLMEGIMAQGFVLDLEAPLSVGTESEVMLSLSGSFLLDEDKPRNEVIVFCREMTARQEIERMRQLEKLKNDFISSITHDLKAPLTSVIGYSDLLLETCADKLQPEEAEYLGIIKQEGMRLTRMINDILNVAKIESGKLQLKPEQIHIKEIIDEVMKVAGAQKDKYSFEASIDNSIPNLWMDKELITRVVMNLVSNAIKYSPQGGQVKVSAYILEENLRIDVSDQGMGMSEESLAHLFEKFFRVKSDATKGISGTGLGLVITKGIVEAHGGSMNVASQLGKGSTFSVILPLSLQSHKPDA
jgi:signal transduction histidine kinase